jgi:porin
MQKKLLLLTFLMLASEAAVDPAFSADLNGAPAAPAPTPAPAPTANDAYTLNLLYTGEGWADVSGGLRRGGSYMYNVDGQLQVDTGKALGWTGGLFEVEGFYANAMSTGNKFVGALDQQSPIDTAADVQMFRLYQLFYDQNFGSTDVRAGIYDLETEFSNTKPMALFLSKNLTWNTAFDQSGTMPENGTIGPGNYPYTPLAVRVRQNFSPSVSVQVAIANGASDNPNNLAQNGVNFSSAYGALFLGEADYTPDKYTKLMAGGWGLTSKLPDFGQYNADGSQRMVYGEEGAYVGGAARLYSAGGKRGLDGFFTLGLSTPQSTNVAESFNTGLVYTGLFDARPGDKIGVSMNINGASNNFRQWQIQQGNLIGAAETSFEVTYRAKINEYLTIQPDIQYINEPNYSHVLKNPLVLGIHFELGRVFEW